MWVNDPKNSTLGSNTGKCLKPSTLKTHKHTHVSHCLYLEYTKDAYTWQAPEPDHSVCVDTLRPSFTQMLLRHKSLEMTIHMGGETARLLFSVIELIPTEWGPTLLSLLTISNGLHTTWTRRRQLTITTDQQPTLYSRILYMSMNYIYVTFMTE